MPVDNKRIAIKLAMILLAGIALVVGGLPNNSYLDWHSDVNERSGRVIDFPTPHNNENCEGLHHMVMAMRICYIVALIAVGLLLTAQFVPFLLKEESDGVSWIIYLFGVIHLMTTLVVFAMMLLIYFFEFCHRLPEKEYADLGYGAGFIPASLILSMIPVFCMSSYDTKPKDPQYNNLKDQYNQGNGRPAGGGPNRGRAESQVSNAEEMQSMAASSRRGSPPPLGSYDQNAGAAAGAGAGVAAAAALPPPAPTTPPPAALAMSQSHPGPPAALNSSVNAGTPPPGRTNSMTRHSSLSQPKRMGTGRPTRSSSITARSAGTPSPPPPAGLPPPRNYSPTPPQVLASGHM